MKINFKGIYEPVKEGFEILASVLGFEIALDGYTVNLLKTKRGHSVSIKDDTCYIKYSSVAGAMRALTKLTHHLKENGNSDLFIEEDEAFSTCGAMIDVSLGATAPTVATWKNYITYLARMGLNMLMIYTEDMFLLEDYPYFGYMRGAYSRDELCEIVDFAEKLGIELIPCIQTLAHLGKVQRWKANAPLFDTQTALLIDDERTYQLIEKMIENARQIYRTDRIHIGMDEAHGVCLGNYYRIHGPTDRYEALLRHLRRVVEICKRYDFKPMMWSDMFFRLGSATNDYYDITAKMPENIGELIPEGLSQVYWDYYHTNANTYEKLILAHKEMGDVIFAGGVWSWTGFAPKYRQTLDSTYPALEMCRKHSIHHVFATVWQSDYSECDFYNALLGLQLYAEYHAGGEVSTDRLKASFKAHTGMNAETFLAMDIDDLGEKNPVYDYDAPYSFSELEHCIPVISKQVLYQDILQGLFDKNFSYIDLGAHFAKCYDRINSLKAEDATEKELLALHTAFTKVIMQKCDIGLRLKDRYDHGDREGLLSLLEELKTLLSSVNELHRLFAARWYKTYKPYSFDERDLRFGGIKARIERAIQRVSSYLKGEIPAIEELEVKRLTFENRETPFAHLYYIEKMRRP